MYTYQHLLVFSKYLSDVRKIYLCLGFSVLSYFPSTFLSLSVPACVLKFNNFFAYRPNIKKEKSKQNKLYSCISKIKLALYEKSTKLYPKHINMFLSNN